ncbi:MAG: hypothetical protein A2X08_12075 [Bacteroidetes bacterium GWA2_32_17]|nr:MAG: hypothetical protein A2X08_12075 [Bacteroidetes bacterium GWA2_32_17]
MKKPILSIICIAISYLTFAQSPQSFQYQAVVRDVNGVALINQPVDFQLSIIPGLPTNPAEYVETHTGLSTNAFGIVTLIVGGGNTTDNFASITWGSAPHFLKVEADMGTGLLDMGTTQLLSVPYALYSETAGNVTMYTAGNGISIAGNVITNIAPDQPVAITGTGATSVTGTYPNFTISSTDNVNDADADATNEIQVLSISNDTLYLSNGGSVFIGNYSDTLWKKSGTDIYNTNFGNVGVGINNPSGRMVIQGSPTALATDPLFEVKNSLGQSVFVVWQDSVQVYINDDAIESNRGGFAISGRNMSKAFTNNYLKVTPDSSRIWTKDTLAGFGVQNINGANKTSYMQLTPKNYFIGHESGLNISSGRYNNFFGYQAGYSDTSGCYNVANGYQALYSNTTGGYNVANGYMSLYANNTGQSNTSNGYQSLYSNTIGSANTANGLLALYSNTDGSCNTANGNQALYSNTNGSYNTANGAYSLLFSTTGTSNTANGTRALYSNTSGSENTASGTWTLYSNDIGYDNTASGAYSLYSNTTGYFNTADGVSSLYSNTTGYYNAANGYRALFYNTTGTSNTAFGFNAGSGAIGVNFNQCTFIGSSSYPIVARTNVTMLGYGITNAQCTGDNQVCIGNTSISSIRAQVTSITAYSDARFKTNIKDNVAGLDFILKLKPVTYNVRPTELHRIWGTPDSLLRKIDHSEIEKIRFIGFLAQDVEKAAKENGFEFPGIDIPKNDKEVYSLRYVDFIMPMVKAVQELNEKISVLEEKNNQLRSDNTILKNDNTQLKTEIQNIKTFIGMSKK